MEISLSKEMINNPLDRPIFIFAMREIDSDDNTYFVTGDKGFFRKGAKERLGNKALHTFEAIELLMN